MEAAHVRAHRTKTEKEKMTQLRKKMHQSKCRRCGVDLFWSELHNLAAGIYSGGSGACQGAQHKEG